MNLLRKIFGNLNPSVLKGGPLRNLLHQYVDRVPPLADRNDHNKCMTVLGSILRFGYSGSSPIPGLSKYTSDSCLFELACYTLASADLWGFNKAPSKRPQIQQILFSQLDAISTRSGFLPEKAAYDYANSRVGLYGGIAADSSSIEGLHYRLNQALAYASSHLKPAPSLDELAPIFGDPFESLGLTKALVDWDMHRMTEMNSTLLTVA